MAKEATHDIRSSSALAHRLCAGLRLDARVFVEYIWLGGSGSASDIRSATRILDEAPSCAEDVPPITLRAAASGVTSEATACVVIRPRVLFSDPFRGGPHLLALCDTNVPHQLDGSGQVAFPEHPHDQNNRAACADMVSRAHSRRPWVAFCQE